MKAKAPADISARDKILESAEELFARRGFAGVGISEIAESAGMGKSSLFHHFHTKAQLYAAVVARILDEIEMELTRTLATGGTPAERLDRWIDTIIDLMSEKPSHSRLLLRSLFEEDEIGDIEEQREANRSLARIIECASGVLRDGMSQGEIRIASIPHTLQSLIGMIIYHFASGEFGQEMLGSSVFSEAQVKRRKKEIKNLLHHSLIVQR